MRRALVALALTGQAGCAMLASANAKHSHITPCIRDPIYSVVDFVIASGLAVALVGTEVGLDNPWWFLAPGVMALSGTLGTIEVIQCRGQDKPAPTTPPIVYPADTTYDPTYPYAKGSGAGSADEIAPELTPPLPTPTGPNLQLGSGYQLGEPVPVPADGGVSPACSMNPIISCPTGYSCQIDGGSSGHCVPD